MKTARERAAEYLDDRFNVSHNARDHYDLEILLKEQDKITREACANAVCPSSRSYDIGTMTAHRKCMNVKAV